MGASYHSGRNGRLNVRWTGWRDEQPDRYPLEVTITGRRRPTAERPSLSRWSDKPRLGRCKYSAYLTYLGPWG
jgi:hypothetical protein